MRIFFFFFLWVLEIPRILLAILFLPDRVGCLLEFRLENLDLFFLAVQKDVGVGGFSYNLERLEASLVDEHLGPPRKLDLEAIEAYHERANLVVVRRAR